MAHSTENRRHARRFFFILMAVLVATLALVVVVPEIDLAVSGLFYAPGKGFPARGTWPVDGLNMIATRGSLALVIVLAACGALAFARKKTVGRLDAKAWFFLLTCLVVGPGLVANVVFKDHWGRARPRDVTAFGGAEAFGPALVPQHACDTNCSFVAGDAAFGFALTALAYVVGAGRRRRVFWSALGIGGVFAAARLVSGAHFLSDILFAAAFMLATLAGIHAVFYGKGRTAEAWRSWFGRG